MQVAVGAGRRGLRRRVLRSARSAAAGTGGRRGQPVTTHVAGGAEGSIRASAKAITSIRASAKAITSGWISPEILIMFE